MLTETQIVSNWETLLKLIETNFPTRKESLLKMYDELEQRMIMMPASSIEYYHNAFPGGYVDHIIRVYHCVNELYDSWKRMGANVDGFTKEELAFAAFHHDLGKAGFPGEGNESYITNDSEWHRKNQGKMYNHNPAIPNATVPDLSLYLLQYYNIPVSWNEYLAIKVHDGMYDDANKPYYMARSAGTKFKTVMPIIMHHADHMASLIEYENWKNAPKASSISTTQSVTKAKSSISKTVTPSSDASLQKAFDEIFKLDI